MAMNNFVSRQAPPPVVPQSPWLVLPGGKQIPMPPVEDPNQMATGREAPTPSAIDAVRQSFTDAGIALTPQDNRALEAGDVGSLNAKYYGKQAAQDQADTRAMQGAKGGDGSAVPAGIPTKLPSTVKNPAASAPSVVPTKDAMAVASQGQAKPPADTAAEPPPPKQNDSAADLQRLLDTFKEPPQPKIEDIVARLNAGEIPGIASQRQGLQNLEKELAGFPTEPEQPNLLPALQWFDYALGTNAAKTYKIPKTRQELEVAKLGLEKAVQAERGTLSKDEVDFIKSQMTHGSSPVADFVKIEQLKALMGDRAAKNEIAAGRAKTAADSAAGLGKYQESVIAKNAAETAKLQADAEFAKTHGGLTPEKWDLQQQGQLEKLGKDDKVILPAAALKSNLNALEHLLSQLPAGTTSIPGIGYRDRAKPDFWPEALGGNSAITKDIVSTLADIRENYKLFLTGTASSAKQDAAISEALGGHDQGRVIGALKKLDERTRDVLKNRESPFQSVLNQHIKNGGISSRDFGSHQFTIGNGEAAAGPSDADLDAAIRAKRAKEGK